MKITLPYQYVPRMYQMPAWQYMQGAEEGKRAVCVWHRRAGKDLFAINTIVPKMFERVGTYWHMLPTYKQGRNIVWNGFTKESKAFLSHFPDELVASKNATEMRITTKNGSIYQVVGTDNINSLVGTNPVGVVFSEYSLHDPAAWDLIRPILAENGGWALFIYTARGKNHGYKLLEMAKKNKKWFQQVLVAGSGPNATKRPDGSPVISDEVIEEERLSLMPEEMIEQEFYCSFEAPLIGAYYGQQMMFLDKQNPKRIGNVPYDPRLPVNTWWDLGMDDSTSIWFAQEYGMEMRLIDYYENSGEGLAHYAKTMKDRGYVYGIHVAPHDINVRELGTGKSRFEVAQDLGIKFRVAKKHTVEDGIEAVRGILPTCWFDETKCERGIAALREYRKDWDEEKKVFRSTPLHNWASHGADAFRIGAYGKKERRKQGKRQAKAEDKHDYLTGGNDQREEDYDAV